ncbi:MAG: glycosyltransferase family 2 protein [Solirubrobacteraceae bacterium]
MNLRPASASRHPANGRPPARVTAAILSYDGRELLEMALPPLLAQTYQEIELLVVDNGSSDGTVAWLHDRWPQVRVVALPANIGVTAALNVCVAEAAGELVALLNNDVELEPDCILRLVQALEEHPDAAVACPKLIDFHHRELLDGAGDVYTWGGEAHRRGQGRRDLGQYDSPQRVFSASGAAALYRRSAFEAVGPFDERFFANCEDTDWSFRANLAGWTCRYVPSAVAYHMGSATLGSGVSDFALFHNWRNGIWVIVKNYPARSLVRHLPDLAFVQARNLAVSLLRGHLRVWLRAWASALAGLGGTLALRRGVQRSRTIPVGRLEQLVGEDR